MPNVIKTTKAPNDYNADDGGGGGGGGGSSDGGNGDGEDNNNSIKPLYEQYRQNDMNSTKMRNENIEF